MMQYKRIQLDASQVRTNEVIDFGGVYSSFMFLVNDVEVGYKINSVKCDTLYVSEMQGFENEGAYTKLFITNTAGTGKIVILAYK